MTPWRTPLDRVQWLLSPNSTAVRVPRAIFDRNNKRYTGERVKLIGRYYIQSIYDSHFYLITWHDDNETLHEKRMKRHTIIAWAKATEGTRPPDADYKSPLLTIAEACQIYHYSNNFLRNKLNSLDPETIAKYTERTTGDRWLIHPDLAQELANAYRRRDNGRSAK